MKPGDKGKIRRIKGKDELILGVDQYGGFTSVEVDKLTMNIDEVFSERSLNEGEMTGNIPPGFRKRPFIQLIKNNIAGNDSMGWKKHRQVLLDNKYDV